MNLENIEYLLGSELARMLPRLSGSDVVHTDDVKYFPEEFEGMGDLEIARKVAEDIRARLPAGLSGVCGVYPKVIRKADGNIRAFAWVFTGKALAK